MARILQEVRNQYTQKCIELGEKTYQKTVLERQIPILLQDCTQLQDEAAAIMETQKAAQAIADAEKAAAKEVAAKLAEEAKKIQALTEKKDEPQPNGTV